MNTENFSQILNLPKLPQELIDECISVVINKGTELIYSDKFIYPNVKNIDGKEVAGSAYLRFALPDRVNKWVASNIKPVSKSGIPTGIQCFWSTTNDFSYAAHVDGKRGQVILFNLDNGGDQVETTWFKEKGKPLFRQFSKEDFYNSITDLTTLEKLHSIIAKEKEWTIIETRVIHAITKLTRPRITLAVGISPEEVDDFCNFHNIDKSVSTIFK